MTTTILETLGRKLDESTGTLAKLDRYYRGEQPAAFLSPAAQTALGDRLRVLAVNHPRLAVDALAERLTVTGFRTGDDAAHDPELWRVWETNGMEDGSQQAHVDALVYGRSFVIVWAGPDKATPRITVESARQVAVEHDPASRQVVAAVKRWVAAGRAHGVVYEADKITRYVSEASVVEDGAIPSTGWRVVEVIDNPLGAVPVVPVVNSGRLLDVDGVSAMADVLDLADALNKLMSDAMVTSEYYARPRRWVTGLEVAEDEEGNPINPFSDELARVWQAEDPAAKFGQFDASRLDGYADLAALITRQISAVTGLPAHYLGIHGDQPPSADAIRSAEASLTARAIARQRTFGRSWSDVARLVVAVRDGVDPAGVAVETTWANPETRTPAQAADAASKLVAAGILPVSEALASLGYTPEQVERIRAARRGEALDAAGVQLDALLP